MACKSYDIFLLTKSHHQELIAHIFQNDFILPLSKKVQ